MHCFSNMIETVRLLPLKTGCCRSAFISLLLRDVPPCGCFQWMVPMTSAALMHDSVDGKSESWSLNPTLLTTSGTICNTIHACFSNMFEVVLPLSYKKLNCVEDFLIQLNLDTYNEVVLAGKNFVKSQILLLQGFWRLNSKKHSQNIPGG